MRDSEFRYFWKRKNPASITAEKNKKCISMRRERRGNLVLLGLMLPIHARCFASVSRMHLRCDFRATEVSETTRKKIRLSSCIAHYCKSLSK